jgi:RNA polymerase sigma-70 factor (ECF subfamily)
MSEVEVPIVPATVEVVAVWFDRHARDLGAYAARRVGPSLARDVVADTFRVACERADAYDPARGGERAWLFGIATNLIRRHWRSEERRLRIQAQTVHSEPSPVDPLLRVEERLDARNRYHLVVDAVAALDPEDRDIVVLIAWEQMSSREAADVLGIQPGTVRSRLNRIRTHLTDVLQEGATHG